MAKAKTKSRAKTAPVRSEPTIKDYRTIPALRQYVDRIGAKQIAVGRFIIEDKGSDKLHYYTEKAMVNVKPNGVIYCRQSEYAPTKEEAEQILSVVSQLKWPTSIPISAAQAEAKRKKEGIDPDHWFVFWDFARKQIIMCQQRIEADQRKYQRKAYVPWTLYDDNLWHDMEPVGLAGLPFWKPDVSRDLRLMVHEGGKAARFCDMLVNSNEPEFKELRKSHPFIDFLKQYEHWGWIGGALAPQRTNYEELKKASSGKMVRFVCDNDHEGKKAIEAVSECYGHQMVALYFDNSFPEGFDMADPIPDDLYEDGIYIGALMEDMDWKQATWATDKIIVDKKAVYKIRRDFTKTITHIVEPDVYIFNDKPHELWAPSQFNDIVDPFSHVQETSALVRKDAAIKNHKLAYMPWNKSGPFLDSDRTNKFNCHMPSVVKPKSGKLDFWQEYIDHLIEDKGDRKLVEKFIATLIACPKIKMAFGMLLRSETQGVGKSHLGEHVLAPILGKHNVSFPSEQQVVESDFNDYLAFKRLVFIHEIYQGSSTRAYNKMKPMFTDATIPINKKYMQEFKIENVVNIIACSNSAYALRVRDDDRRLLIPKVRETLKPHEWWVKFHHYLYREDGHGIILRWALDYDDYFEAGLHAPDTKAKARFIEEQRSDGEQYIFNILEAVKDKNNGHRFVLFDSDVRNRLIDRIYEGRQTNKTERAATIRKIAEKVGYFVNETRVAVAAWGTQETKPYMLCSSKSDASRSPSDVAKDKDVKLVRISDMNLPI